MANTTATVTEEGIALPAEFMSELDLKPGAQVKVTSTSAPTADVSLIVEPKPPKTRTEIEEILQAARKTFAGGPSLEDEYFRDKEKDKW